MKQRNAGRGKKEEVERDKKRKYTITKIEEKNEAKKMEEGEERGDRKR